MSLRYKYKIDQFKNSNLLFITFNTQCSCKQNNAIE